jgi:hypothetical protein
MTTLAPAASVAVLDRVNARGGGRHRAFDIRRERRRAVNGTPRGRRHASVTSPRSSAASQATRARLRIIGRAFKQVEAHQVQGFPRDREVEPHGRMSRVYRLGFGLPVLRVEKGRRRLPSFDKAASTRAIGTPVQDHDAPKVLLPMIYAQSSAIINMVMITERLASSSPVWRRSAL